MLTLDEFKELKTKQLKKDTINSLLESNSVFKSCGSLGITNIEMMTDFYELLLKRIKNSEELTDDLVDYLYNSLLKKDEQPSQNNITFMNYNSSSNKKEQKEQQSECASIKYCNIGSQKYPLKRSTTNSIGYDLYLDRCITDEEIGDDKKNIDLLPGEHKLYGTGIKIELPKGYYGQVYTRSGLCEKGCRIMLANSVGIIDNDYRGEIILKLINVSKDHAFGPSIGQRVAQLVIQKEEIFPVTEVQEISETERGKHGFGSTGKE